VSQVCMQLVLALHGLQEAVVAQCLHEQDTALYLLSLAPFGEAFWEVSQVHMQLVLTLHSCCQLSWQGVCMSGTPCSEVSQVCTSIDAQFAASDCGTVSA
jgi:hypothetical protein